MTVSDSSNQYLQLIVTETLMVTETVTEKIALTVNDIWLQLMAVTTNTYNRQLQPSVTETLMVTEKVTEEVTEK